MVPIKRVNSFIVDDRVRWVIFSPRIVQEPDPEVNIRSDFVEYLLNPPPPPRNSLPGSAFVREIGPFNDRWQRDVKLVNPQGVTTFQQRLTALSPYAARVDSINYPWRVCYFTQ